MGLAAATAVAAAAGAYPAAAQTLPGILPPSSRPLEAPRPPRPQPSGAQASVEHSLRDSVRPTGSRGTAGTAPDGISPIVDETDPIAKRQPPPGLRAAIRDGDLRYPPEPDAERDGVAVVGELPATPDGIDPVNLDARPPDDLAPFEPPAAIRDPLLFQIEDIEPLADRRTGRLFRFEPYDPVGIRIGSFILFPEAELGGAAFSNKQRSPNGKSDVALEAKPAARLVSDWRQHALELRTSGGLSFHDAFPGEDERSYVIEARGRLDVTRRTNVQALYAHQVTQESRSGIDANRMGERADITTDQLVAALNHRFNRLSVQLRGGVTETRYGETVSPMGGLVTNRERNVTETTETARASWEFKPTLSAFSEGTLVQREHQAPASSDRLWRNSDGERFRAGLSFGETGAYLRGEASLGWGRQRPDDVRLRDTDAFLVDANLAWRITPLTSLLVAARTDIADTTTEGSPAVISRMGGVEVRHALRRNLIANAGVQVTRSDYQGVVLDETEVAAKLGAEYYLNREITIFTRYQHIWFGSSETNRDYEADEVRVGMKVRR